MAKRSKNADPICAEALQRIETYGKQRKTHLDLSGLGLTTLPPEIGKLTALRELRLDSNQLKALPPVMLLVGGLFQCSPVVLFLMIKPPSSRRSSEPYGESG